MKKGVDSHAAISALDLLNLLNNPSNVLLTNNI